jgi:hypothetical protein
MACNRHCTRSRLLRRHIARSKRIKSFCGAKPPQKLGWTNAGRWGVEAAMEISPRTLGAQVDDRGSIDAA